VAACNKPADEQSCMVTHCPGWRSCAGLQSKGSSEERHSTTAE
jgi:hypothetical protein